MTPGHEEVRAHHGTLVSPRKRTEPTRSVRTGAHRNDTLDTSSALRPAAVRVRIRSDDRLAYEGVRSMLAQLPRIRFVPDDEDGTAQVVVLVAERFGQHEIERLQCRSDGDRDRSEPAMLLIIDDFNDDDLITALDAGVAAVLRRSETSRSQLVTAVLALADGAVVLPPRLQAMLVRQLRRVRTDVLDPNGLTLSGLTARERDVLRLVAEGLDTEEIARGLSLSPRTVKYVLTHVMNRYDLRSRTHAVAFAVRAGAI